MSEKPVMDWGQAPPGPPSTRRVAALDWVLASLALGLLAFALVLTLLWRPLPALAAPPGEAREHAASWAKITVRTILPSWFRDSAAYAKQWETLRVDQKQAVAWRLILALLAALTPGAGLAFVLLTPRDGLIHLRGSRRFEGSRAVKELQTRLASRCKARPDHEIAPGVAFPGDLWTRHVLLVGGVGSGKSTALKPILDKVIGAGEQVLLFDPKSEFTIGWSQPAIIAPWDSRSLAWDLARDMRNVLDMRRFAAAMIRESQDPMWSNASRQLLVGLMIHLKRERGLAWGWRDLAELVALPQAQLLPIMRECHPEAVRAVEKASVTTVGILINLSSFCSSIFDLAEAWGDAPPERRVSFVEWTLGCSPHRQLILQGHGAYSDLTKSYVEGVVGIVAAIVNSVEMRDDPKRKIWFIADELPQMGKIPIRALFEVGRSRGVRCVVACQDFAQLEEIYGAPMVKAIVAMSGTILVGQVMQGETAEALCKSFGTREVERANISSSYQGAGGSSSRSSTLSYNRDEIALYKPSELASRLGLAPNGKGVRLILFTGGDAFELTWPHFPLRDERSGHEPAPWTLGLEGRFSGADAQGQGEGVNAPPPTDAKEHEERVQALSKQDQEDAKTLASIGDPDPELVDAGSEESAKTLGPTGEEVVVRARAPGAGSEDGIVPVDSGSSSDAVQALAAEAVAGDIGVAVSHLAQALDATLREHPGPREDVRVLAAIRRNRRSRK